MIHPQQTIMIVEREDQRHFTGILDKNGQPIIAREIREPIGFYVLREEEEETNE